MKIREDKTIRPDGQPGIYGYMSTPPAVFILAVTKNLELYLIKQQRYTFAGLETIEILAGNTDGEDKLKAAKRELKEETGLSAKKWTYLGEAQPFNALSSEINYFYLAQKLTQTGEDKRAEDGISQVVKQPYLKVVRMIKTGKIVDGQSITGIMKAGLQLGLLKF